MAALVVQVHDHISQGWSWFQVVAPALSAIAAGASWRAVFQTRRTQVDADVPQLVFHLMGESVPLTLEIQNVGRGVAVHPGYAILSGLPSGQAIKGTYPGSLLPNEKAEYRVPFPTTEDALGIVFTEDRHNNVHVWSATNKYRRYKKGSKGLTPRVFLGDLYGKEAVARPDSATWVAAELKWVRYLCPYATTRDRSGAHDGSPSTSLRHVRVKHYGSATGPSGPTTEQSAAASSPRW